MRTKTITPNGNSRPLRPPNQPVPPCPMGQGGTINGACPMASYAYFADLPNGETMEFRGRREKTYVTREGYQRYRDVPAKVGLMLPTWLTMGNGNVLCGYVEGKGWTPITR